MSINNKTKTCDKRTKRFSWSLEFNNDIIWYKYVFITYIFKNKFSRFIFQCFFQWKHMTNFIHNCNLQTTTNKCNFFFIFILESIVTKIPTNYPTIIIGDFNISMLTNTIESITLQNYMNTHNFHITFIQSITFNNTQINHIWTNASTQ
jgi:hypothetical protein